MASQISSALISIETLLVNSKLIFISDSTILFKSNKTLVSFLQNFLYNFISFNF